MNLLIILLPLADYDDQLHPVHERSSWVTVQSEGRDCLRQESGGGEGEHHLGD